MSTVIPSTSTKALHPAGRFLGTLADVYILREKNQFFGKAGIDKQIDNRETVDRVYLTFVTSAGVVTQRYTASTSPKSTLYKVLCTWQPKLAGRLGGFDLDRLIGKGADLTITLKPNRDGTKEFNDVTAIIPMRDGDVAPEIPGTFNRADVDKLQEFRNRDILNARDMAQFEADPKQSTAGTANTTSASSAPADDDDLPF